MTHTPLHRYASTPHCTPGTQLTPQRCSVKLWDWMRTHFPYPTGTWCAKLMKKHSLRFWETLRIQTFIKLVVN